MNALKEFSDRLAAGEHLRAGNLLFAVLPPRNLYFKHIEGTRWLEIDSITMAQLEDIAACWHDEQPKPEPQVTRHVRKIEL